MKKILSILLFAAMIFTLAIPAAAVVNLNPNNAAVNIDGIRDDAYSGPVAVATHHQNADGTNSMDSATGNVWTAWDSTNLYFYIEVADNTPNHEVNADNVEFMIDWNSGKWDSDFATPETPYWQVRAFANPPNPDGANINGLIMDSPGIDWGRNFASELEPYCKWSCGPINGNYNNGYIIEISIAAPEGVSLTEGMTIPIEIQICDNMKGEDTRDGQVFLEPSDNNDKQWNTPNSCNGLLTLGSEYVEMVVIEEAAPAPETNSAVETPTPAVAPQTGDFGFLFVIAVIGSFAFAITVFKKAKSVK